MTNHFLDIPSPANRRQALRIAFANAEATDMETVVDRLVESQG